MADKRLVERRNGYNGNLRLRFAIDFGAQSSQFLLGRRAEYACEIIHIPLRFEVLDLLREHTPGAKNRQ